MERHVPVTLLGDAALGAGNVVLGHIWELLAELGRLFGLVVRQPSGAAVELYRQLPFGNRVLVRDLEGLVGDEHLGLGDSEIELLVAVPFRGCHSGAGLRFAAEGFVRLRAQNSVHFQLRLEAWLQNVSNLRVLQLLPGHDVFGWPRYAGSEVLTGAGAFPLSEVIYAVQQRTDAVICPDPVVFVAQQREHVDAGLWKAPFHILKWTI